MSSRQLNVPCLGRPFRLGMLYDCRTDQLVPGITFWDADILSKHKISERQSSSNTEFIADDTLGGKTFHLGIDAGLKLSILGGLVSVNGSAKYLDDRKTSADQVRVSLKYSATTAFEQLSMNQLSELQHRDIVSYDTATHVVTGVKYGADAFFVFDQMVSKDEKYREIQGNLEAGVKRIPSFSVASGGGAIIKEGSTKNTSSFQCKFYGDMILPENPCTYEEAIKVYKELPKLIETTESSNAVAKEVWLYPLNILDNKAKSITKEIRTRLVCRVETFMENLHKATIQSNDICKSEIMAKFINLQEQMSEFCRLVKMYKTDIMKQISQVLPAIRGGGAAESELSDIMIKDDNSPFSHKVISNWLNKKENEIKLLSAFLKNLGDIEFIADPGDLDSFLYSDDIENVVCFEFNVIQYQDAYLEKLCLYLSTGQVPQNLKIFQYWHENRKIKYDLNVLLKQFKEFAKRNRMRQQVKFVVVSGSSDISDEAPKPAILLYSGGICNPFIPPGKPGKPKTTQTTSESITIQWKQPEEGNEGIIYYTVYYKKYSSSDWHQQKTSSNCTDFKLCKLEPSERYLIKVCSESEVGSSLESEMSDIRTKAERETLALKMFKQCKQIEEIPTKNTPLIVCQLPFKRVMSRKFTYRSLNLNPGEELKLAKYEIGERVISSKPLEERVLMVVGATGTGKTTLINGFANYMYEVKRDDNFRFKVISDEGQKAKTESQTTDISAYTFYPQKGSQVPYILTLIDTPGFGDSRGVERDEAIVKQMEHFFRVEPPHGINILHGIGFVIKACDERLTVIQKYVFHSILAIYGKDIKGNIFLMTTFCDGKRPLVLGAAEAAGVPYETYFKFNNSALFGDGSDQFDKMFWELGMTSFKEFFEKFERAEPKSLQLTKEVLREREQLETFIQGLQTEVTNGLSRIDELQQKERAVKAQNNAIVTKKGATYFTFDVTEVKEEEIPDGKYTTTCLTCNRTCHETCIYNNDADKYKCSAMTSGGRKEAHCRVCPRKCFWDKHRNTPYRITLVRAKKQQTFEDLEKEFKSANPTFDNQDETDIERHRAYKEAESELNDLEKHKALVQIMVNNINHELDERQKKVFSNIRKAKQSINRLNEIALKSNPLTDEQYIQLLIQSEKQEKKAGFIERVDTLEKIKEKAKFAQTIQKVDERQPTSTKDQKWWQSFIKVLFIFEIPTLGHTFFIVNTTKEHFKIALTD